MRKNLYCKKNSMNRYKSLYDEKFGLCKEENLKKFYKTNEIEIPEERYLETDLEYLD